MTELIWEAHEHYWRSGEFSISSASVGGAKKYTLWERSYAVDLAGTDVLHATYATAGEAKAHAQRLVGLVASAGNSD